MNKIDYKETIEELIKIEETFKEKVKSQETYINQLKRRLKIYEKGRLKIYENGRLDVLRNELEFLEQDILYYIEDNDKICDYINCKWCKNQKEKVDLCISNINNKIDKIQKEIKQIEEENFNKNGK